MRVKNKYILLFVIFFQSLFGLTQNDLLPNIKEAVEADWSNPTGPYSVIMEIDKTLKGHTIYRPASLDDFPLNEKLPIIAFSGPGCDFDGTSFRPFYTEIASYGFLVIVSGLPWSDYEAKMAAPKTTGKDLKEAIGWAISENIRKTSKYYGKVDTKNVAVMGQSCGGLQTLGILDDKRITLLALWNSGMFEGSPSMMKIGSETLSGTREDLKLLHTPVAYFVGGTDMARPNAAGDFEEIENVPVFMAVNEIEGDAHAGTFREKNGGSFAVAGVAWVMWNMKGDKKAAEMFKGNPCGLATDKNWIEIRKKNID